MKTRNDVLVLISATNDDLIYLFRIYYLETTKASKLDLVNPVLIRIKSNLNRLVETTSGMSNTELNFKVPFITKEEFTISDWLELIKANVVNIVEKIKSSN